MNDRVRKEMKSLFEDPKFSRKAWQAVGYAILTSKAVKSPIVIDKDGNESYDSLVESYAYKQLSEDIRSLGNELGEPTELEMILRCQAMHARHNTAAATFIRDTVGARPIDESKVDQVVHNAYETLSDEELTMIEQMRAKKALPSEEPPAITATIVEQATEEQHVD